MFGDWEKGRYNLYIYIEYLCIIMYFYFLSIKFIMKIYLIARYYKDNHDSLEVLESIKSESVDIGSVCIHRL